MGIKIAINLDEISDSIEEAVEFLTKNEVKYAEIRTVKGKNIADFSDEEVKDLKKTLSGSGLEVSAIASPLFKWYPEGYGEEKVTHDNHGFNPYVNLSQKRKYIQNIFNACQILETDKVRVFSNLRQPGMGIDTFYNDKLFGEMVEEAEKRKIVVMLENEPPCIVYKKSQYLEVFRKFNSKYLGAWVDIANFYHEGENIDSTYLQLLREYIGYVHIKDFDGPRTLNYVPVGSGFINYKRIFTDLTALLGDREVMGSIETHVKENKVKATQESLEHINKVLAEPNRVGYAIVGTGRIAKKHAAALKKNFNSELRCVLDINEEGAANYAEENDAVVCQSIGELLDEPSVKVVTICTPHRTHITIAKEVISRRKIVLSEKPFAINSKELEEYLKDPDAKSSTFVVFQYIFNPPVVKLLKNLNKIGEILFFAVNIRWWRDDEYFKGWQGNKAVSGGSLFNQSIHLIHLLLLVVGLDVQQVYSLSRKLRKHSEVEDLNLTTVKLKDGTFGYIETCLFTHKRNLEYSVFVTGTKGTVKIGGPALNEELYFYPSEDLEEVTTSQADAENYGQGHVKLIGTLSDLLLGRPNENSELLFKAEQLLPITKFIEETYRNEQRVN